MASTHGLRRAAALSCLSSIVSVLAATPMPTDAGHWVDIFGTMPQLVEPWNLPSGLFNGSGVVFANTTLRQTLFLTQPATTIRIHLTNAFGLTDLPITAATIALPVEGNRSGTSAIQPATVQALTFGGPPTALSQPSPNTTIPPGASALSDPVTLPATLPARSVLTLSLYLAAGQASPSNAVTGHPGSCVMSYLAHGNLVAAPDLTNTSAADPVQALKHWYFVSTVQAWLPPRQASLVVVVGDSLTDGEGSTTNLNNRWPDQLVARMQAPTAGRARDVAVVNEGANGNRVLVDGFGPSVLARLQRDVLARPAARWVILFAGINDIIGEAPTDPATQAPTGTLLVAAYGQIVARLHAAGLVVWCATLTPFVGSGQTYGDPQREVTRQHVNAWIRGSGLFDAVLDFDAAVRDPDNGTRLRPQYDVGDHLHLNPEGYGVLAKAVDLGLFEK